MTRAIATATLILLYAMLRAFAWTGERAERLIHHHRRRPTAR